MNELMSAAVAGRREGTAAGAAARGAPLARRSAAVAGLEIAIHAELHGVERLWRKFESGADCTVFQNFDYLAVWQRNIGARRGVTPAIAVLQHESRVVAILPLAVSGPAVLRRLTWHGQDPSDYLAPLLARDFSSVISPAQFVALWLEIRGLMQTDPRFRHDVIDLRRMPATVGRQGNPFAALPLTRHPSDSFAATLSASWDTFYRSRRTAKARRQDRSKRKRLSELGTIRLVTPDNRADVARAIDTLFALKAVTFARKGITDKFGEPASRKFYLDLATDPRTREIAHVSVLEVGGVPAAVNFGLEFRGRYALCLVGFDERLARYSPGVIHLNELMQRAVERGLLEFDFLVGSQRLKREWTDRRLPVFDCSAGATLRGSVAAMALRAFTGLKRRIKTTPALWEAFERARTFAGALRRGGAPGG